MLMNAPDRKGCALVQAVRKVGSDKDTDDYRAVVPDFLTVIPAKAGIQRFEGCRSRAPKFRISTPANANLNMP